MAAVGGPLIRAYQVSVTVATGSTSAAPVTTPIVIDDIYCYSVEVEVPDGPAGLMGFYIQYASTQIVPWGPNGTYLRVDDYEHTYPVEAELGKSLAVVAYNTGAWPHTIYMRFLGTPIGAYQASQPVAPVTPIDFGQ